MDAMDVVLRWDRSLRIGDWEAARTLLTEDATYTAPGLPEGIDCLTPDAIIQFLRSLTGTVPDVEVIEWEELGDRVLVQLRQPAWGEDSDWFQVLWVRDGLIAKMEDYQSRAAAIAATG